MYYIQDFFNLEEFMFKLLLCYFSSCRGLFARSICPCSQSVTIMVQVDKHNKTHSRDLNQEHIWQSQLNIYIVVRTQF